MQNLLLRRVSSFMKTRVNSEVKLPSHRRRYHALLSIIPDCANAKLSPIANSCLPLVQRHAEVLCKVTGYKCHYHCHWQVSLYYVLYTKLAHPRGSESGSEVCGFNLQLDPLFFQLELRLLCTWMNLLAQPSSGVLFDGLKIYMRIL